MLTEDRDFDKMGRTVGKVSRDSMRELALRDGRAKRLIQAW